MFMILALLLFCAGKNIAGIWCSALFKDYSTYWNISFKEGSNDENLRNYVTWQKVCSGWEY